jgi:hypothetical protein
MAYQSGSGGYVEVGGTRLDVTGWEAEEASDWADTTNSASGGYRESILVRKAIRGTVNADFDPAKGPKGSPTIGAGQSAAVCLRTASGGRYEFTANVERLRWVVPAGDKISFAFDFESNGAYSYTP